MSAEFFRKYLDILNEATAGLSDDSELKAEVIEEIKLMMEKAIDNGEIPIDDVYYDFGDVYDDVHASGDDRLIDAYMLVRSITEEDDVETFITNSKKALAMLGVTDIGIDEGLGSMVKRAGKAMTGTSRIEKAYSRHRDAADAATDPAAKDRALQKATKSMYVGGADKANKAYDRYHEKKYGSKPDRDGKEWDEVSEDLVSEYDDPLEKRIGINTVNKKPRAGQTDFRNIPAGNYPGTGRPFSDKDRSNQPSHLKKSLRSAQGKHGPKGRLPENKFNEATNDSVRRDRLGQLILGTYGKIYDFVYEYGDSALDYMERNAPHFHQLFHKYDGDMDAINANESIDSLRKAAEELRGVLSDLAGGELG